MRAHDIVRISVKFYARHLRRCAAAIDWEKGKNDDPGAIRIDFSRNRDIV
jgi:hypothetical protein